MEDDAASHADSRSNGPEEWDDWEEGEEDVGEPPRCLFCSMTAAPLGTLLAHMSDAHGFDTAAALARAGMRAKAWCAVVCCPCVGTAHCSCAAGPDFYRAVAMINYIRSQVAARGGSPDAVAHIVASITPDADFWRDQAFLRPVLPDDALIADAELLVAAAAGADLEADGAGEEGEGEEELTAVPGVSVAMPGQGAGGDADEDLPALEEAGAGGAEESKDSAADAHTPSREQGPGQVPEDVLSLRHEVAALRAALARQGQQCERMRHLLQGMTGEDAPTRLPADNDTYYFDSYSRLDIHEDMLKDRVRCSAHHRRPRAADACSPRAVAHGSVPARH